MQPTSDVVICNCKELDLDYSNTWSFQDKQTQFNYFMQRPNRFVFNDYTYIRQDNAIQVGIHFDKIHECNYVIYQNADGKTYYCFIVRKEYINENVTKIHMKTDILQTYLFDFELKESYVDRCHVNRWKADFLPSMEIEPEDLEFGNYILDDNPREVYPFNESFVAITQSPLGQVKNRPTNTGGGTGGGGDCGDWERGIVSPDLLRMVKGYEAFAPYKINAPGSVVISYGLTPQGEPNEFKYLEGRQPVDEVEGARITYECLNKYYGNSYNLGMHTVEYFKKVFHVDSQHKFDALIDLFYTTGQVALMRGDLHDALRDHPNDENIVRPIWERWYTNNLSHLKKRRRGECDLYFGKGYTKDPIGIYDARGNLTPKVVETNNGNGWLPDCDGAGGDPQGCKLDYEAYNMKWTYPVHGTVTSKFPIYPSTGGYHSGTDIGCNIGTPVYATRDLYIEEAGEVRNSAGQLVSFGIFIRAVVEGTTYKVWYAHLSRHNCKTGDHVKCGQIIGYSGNTGNSRGPHLHYEMRKKPWRYTQDCIDPIPSINVNDKI